MKEQGAEVYKLNPMQERSLRFKLKYPGMTDPLTKEQSEYLRSLVDLKDRLESITEEDIKNLYPDDGYEYSRVRLGLEKQKTAKALLDYLKQPR